MSNGEQLLIDLPGWVVDVVSQRERYPSDEDRMALAIQLARQNVLRENGGPFGAVVFDDATGQVIAAGVNRVQQLKNCALHAEVTALMFAQQHVGCHTLYKDDGPIFMLATSCDPCAMCLGAVLWSGVRRVVCGATRDDAMAFGFDEGPVFPESHAYLRARGIGVTHGVLRNEASDVLRLYAERGGTVYNGLASTP